MDLRKKILRNRICFLKNRLKIYNNLSFLTLNNFDPLSDVYFLMLFIKKWTSAKMDGKTIDLEINNSIFRNKIKLQKIDLCIVNLGLQ